MENFNYTIVRDDAAADAVTFFPHSIFENVGHSSNTHVSYTVIIVNIVI